MRMEGRLPSSLNVGLTSATIDASKELVAELLRARGYKVKLAGG